MINLCDDYELRIKFMKSSLTKLNELSILKRNNVRGVATKSLIVSGHSINPAYTLFMIYVTK